MVFAERQYLNTLFAISFLGVFSTYAADVAFWRIASSSTTVVSAIHSDGVLIWSNSVSGFSDQVQRNESPNIDDNWLNITLVPSTGTISSVRVVDPTLSSDMVLVPAGIFVMGAATNLGQEALTGELPQHEVFVSEFRMDRYEVTKSLWDSVKSYADSNGYSFSSSVSGKGKSTNHPVQRLSWFDAAKWCNARSQRDGLLPVYYSDADFNYLYTTGDISPYANWIASGYRLPTEAEWEKAARAGQAFTRFPWAHHVNFNSISHAKANYYGFPGFPYDSSNGYNTNYVDGVTPYTSPVGQFAPNDFALYDMAGNVHEWCWDWYDSGYYTNSPGIDPQGPSDGLRRVTRGGSFADYANVARCAARLNSTPNTIHNTIGFRCVRR